MSNVDHANPLVALTIKELIAWLLSLPKSLFELMGVPDYLVAELSAALVLAVAGLGASLVFKPVRRLARSALLWLTDRLSSALGGSKAPDDQVKENDLIERDYLRWLKTEIANTSSQWHESPIVPTPAHEKRPLGRLVRYRARLFRHNTKDYAENPLLNDADLAIRATFGSRVRIRDLAQELRRYKKIIVLGDPGSGKSVCLRQLAFDLCEAGLSQPGSPATLPIFIDMGAYETWDDEQARKPTDFLTFLTKTLSSHPSVVAAPSTHPLIYISKNLETLLHQGRVTLILDALDEMPQDSYQERYQVIKQFMVLWESFESNRFIFSCRILDYDPAFGVDEVIIDKFDRERIKAFLLRHVPAVADALYRRIIEDEALEELVGNPFFLQALTYINAPHPDSSEATSGIWVPATRGELLKEFVDQLIEREAGDKQRAYLDSVAGGLPTLRSFLSDLAFALQQRREGRTSAQTAELMHILEKYPSWPILLWVSRRARIVGKRGETFHELADTSPPNISPPERIEFMHHRLQEFFAAEELARRLSEGEAIESYVKDLWWQETVVFAIASISDPDAAIQRLLEPQTQTDSWIGEVIAIAKAQPRRQMKATTERAAT